MFIISKNNLTLKQIKKMTINNANKTIEWLQANEVHWISQNPQQLNLEVYEQWNWFSVVVNMINESWEFNAITLSYWHEFWILDEKFYRDQLIKYWEDRLWEQTFWRRMNLVDWVKNNLNKSSDTWIEEFEIVNEEIDKEEKEQVQKDIEWFTEEIIRIFEEKKNTRRRIENLYNKLDSKIENASNPISKLTYQLSKSMTIALVKNKHWDLFQQDEIQNRYEEDVKSFLTYIFQTTHTYEKSYEIQEFDITIPKEWKFWVWIKIKNNRTWDTVDIKKTMDIENNTKDIQLQTSLVKKKLQDFFEKFEF